jgi:hypothetical protein
VFCKEIAQVRQYCSDLVARGIPKEVVSFYFSTNSASKPEQIKQLLQQEKDFREGRVHVLFATCALGLGYDKSDIHHVVHLWTPNSIVQYYQEFGRAGRSIAGAAATAHLLPTAPWNPTGWATVLSGICWFLARTNENKATEVEIRDRGRQFHHKESDVNRAIELGVNKGYLRRVMGDQLQLVNGHESLLKIDNEYATQMKEEVEVMYKLSHNGGQDHLCLWRFILSQFEGRDNPELTCNRCSGLLCQPGGDIAPCSQDGSNVFYRIDTAGGTHVFALNKVGETLSIDEDRLKEIFFYHRPSMVCGQ